MTDERPPPLLDWWGGYTAALRELREAVAGHELVSLPARRAMEYIMLDMILGKNKE